MVGLYDMVWNWFYLITKYVSLSIEYLSSHIDRQIDDQLSS
jgi:hypothetical protein